MKTSTEIEQAVAAAIEAERERCAQVAEDRADGWRGVEPFERAVMLHDEGKTIAHRIRNPHLFPSE